MLEEKKTQFLSGIFSFKVWIKKKTVFYIRVRNKKCSLKTFSISEKLFTTI